MLGPDSDGSLDSSYLFCESRLSVRSCHHSPGAALTRPGELTESSGGLDLYTVNDGISEGGVGSLSHLADPFTLIRCAGKRATITASGGPKLIGTNGRDIISGGDKTDIIRGRRGNDLICGLGGRDRLLSGAGRDRLFGGAAGDQLIGGDGNDRCAGGNGHDRLSNCEKGG